MTYLKTPSWLLLMVCQALRLQLPLQSMLIPLRKYIARGQRDSKTKGKESSLSVLL